MNSPSQLRLLFASLLIFALFYLSCRSAPVQASCETAAKATNQPASARGLRDDADDDDGQVSWPLHRPDPEEGVAKWATLQVDFELHALLCLCCCCCDCITSLDGARLIFDKLLPSTTSQRSDDRSMLPCLFPLGVCVCVYPLTGT